MRSYLFYLLCICIFMSCDQQQEGENYGASQSDSTEIDSKNTEPTTNLSQETETDTTDATEDISEKTDDEIEDEIKAFVPEGFRISMWKKGNLNRDNREDDVVLILEDISESEDDVEQEEQGKRPVILLTRDAKGNLREEARNKNIVICASCGGLLGDPLIGISIKNGYFSIEHLGGSRWRWERITTFKYSDKDKTWYLHKDGSIEYDIYDETGKKDETVRSKKDFGEIIFVDYHRNDIAL